MKSIALAAAVAALPIGSLSALELSTVDFCPGGRIPARFTADGRDVSPELRVADAPKGTRSLVLIVEDPDAAGTPFTHWLLWNIDPAVTVISRGRTPRGAVAGRNGFGTRSYRGPDPPSGLHRYVFRLYALDARLDLPPGADRSVVEQAMRGRVLARAELLGYYERRGR